MSAEWMNTTNITSITLVEGRLDEASLCCADMRRKKRREPDEAQSSLDRFSGAPPSSTPPDEQVPSMPDLDLLEAAEARLDTPPSENVNAVQDDEGALRQFEMPSNRREVRAKPASSTLHYHDLGVMYPNAPVPSHEGGMVLHNSTLHDLTGCSTLMNWVADGHACIVEMKRMMQRTTEFNQALSTLHAFVEGDAQGQIIRITDTRLMLLPQGCRGLRGTEMEGFTADQSDFSEV